MSIHLARTKLWPTEAFWPQRKTAEPQINTKAADMTMTGTVSSFIHDTQQTKIKDVKM
jgi:hypothetical protein